ncbi:hypothetical protein GOP47_0011803 [Adiantum capillus-veneris]|uniref:DNA polymerase delta subunit 3 n=1 Tax=Adiantum capillus-veneris TaxID=13818 RepID=A0A9D4UU00_ADICA|nr:hypothetical protein GOP47_0011803 [Adiantum capillus-veneris]
MELKGFRMDGGLKLCLKPWRFKTGFLSRLVPLCRSNWKTNDMMAEGIERTSQILAFVLDSLQVVSYKWLSRKFSISSNESKRLLQIVAEQHGGDLDIVYAVSGWSKSDCNCYSVKLVPKAKLQEAKDMLNGHVSIHVYSIQPCIPKDPAELWSAEYVQSEELFKQPSELNNCLRDNRFSAVSCGLVTRKVTDTCFTGGIRTASFKVAQSVSASKVAAPSTSATKVAVPPPSPPPTQPSTVKAEVLAVPASTSGQSMQNAPGNSVSDMGTASKGSETLAGPKGVAATKKKTGDTGSLANLWGRASTKSKAMQIEAQVEAAANTGTMEIPEVVHDPCINESSDDEDAANFARLRRGDLKSKGKRTRRMVVDDDISDEDNADETFVSLSSPEVPKEKKETSVLPDKNGKRSHASEAHLKEEKEDTICTVRDKEKKNGKKKLDADNQASEPARTVTNGKKKLDADNQTSGPARTTTKGASAAAPEPKKRKVLKTKMDERGREVTEVVWEFENPVENDSKKEDKSANAHVEVQMASTKIPSMKSSGKASNAAVQNPGNKAPGGRSSGKAASKDAQQGRISSFFKKKN